MEDVGDGGSINSEGHEIDDEWDVIDAENEMAQLNDHFKEGGVGASLCIEASQLEGSDALVESDEMSDQNKDMMYLIDSNASLKLRITELEHELKYADKARVNAEKRTAHLSASNAALADETLKLTEALSRLKKDMDGVVTEKKNLEMNTNQLESFVEETISNSQSGYIFLCEARERVTDITKELIGLRNFLTGNTSSFIVDDSLGFQGGVLQSVKSDLNVTLDLYKEVFTDVSTEIRKLKAVAGSAVEAMPLHSPEIDAGSNKITLKNFNEGDIAMFFPTPKGDYVAFNLGSPHHYLSEESKALIGHDPHFKKVYVLGRIIMKEEKLAAINAPYNLKDGTVYYEISVESIADMFPTAAMKGSSHTFRDGPQAATAGKI